MYFLMCSFINIYLLFLKKKKERSADIKHLKTMTENTVDSKTDKKGKTGFTLWSLCVCQFFFKTTKTCPFCVIQRKEFAYLSS